MMAGIAFGSEAGEEERLDRRSCRGHRSPSRAVRTRFAVTASSSGTPVKYQLFRNRNNWYYSDSRVIPMLLLCVREGPGDLG